MPSDRNDKPPVVFIPSFISPPSIMDRVEAPATNPPSNERAMALAAAALKGMGFSLLAIAVIPLDNWDGDTHTRSHRLVVLGQDIGDGKPRERYVCSEGGIIYAPNHAMHRGAKAPLYGGVYTSHWETALARYIERTGRALALHPVSLATD